MAVWQLAQIIRKNKNLSVAESAALASLSIERSAAGDPLETLSLLHRAIWTDKGSLRPHTAEIDQALLSFLFQPYPVRVLKQHSDAVSALDIDADLALMVSGADNGEVLLWSMDDYALISVLPSHLKHVNDVKIAESGDFVVTSSTDQSVRIIDLKSGKKINEKMIRSSMARTVDISPEHQELLLLPMADQKDVMLYDSSNQWMAVGKLVHPSIVSTAAFSPDGMQIITSDERQLRIWNTKDCLGRKCEPYATYSGHSREVRDVQFDATGDRFGSVSSDARLLLWDQSEAQNNLPAVDVELPPGQLNQQLYERSLDSIDFSQDSSVVITGSGNDSAQIWETISGKQLASLNGHAGHVRHACFFNNKQSAVTASDDTTIRIWDTSRSLQSQSFRPENGRVSHAVFSASESYLYGVASGNIFKIDIESGAFVWNISIGHLPGAEQVAEFSPRSISLNPDETTLVVPGLKHILVVNSEDAHVVNLFPVHRGKVMWAQYSPNGKYIATAGGDDNSAAVLDANTGDIVKRFTGHHTDWVEYVEFHPDGNMLLTASRDGRVIVWNVETEQPEAILKEHGNWVFHATFSTDGSRIISQSNEQSSIWDWRSENIDTVLKGHQQLVYFGAVHPAAKILATAGQEGNALLWTDSGRKLAELKTHTGSIRSLSFSKSGEKLVTTSDDGTLRVWDTSTSDSKLLMKELCTKLEC